MDSQPQRVCVLGWKCRHHRHLIQLVQDRLKAMHYRWLIRMDIRDWYTQASHLSHPPLILKHLAVMRVSIHRHLRWKWLHITVHMYPPMVVKLWDSVCCVNHPPRLWTHPITTISSLTNFRSPIILHLHHRHLLWTVMICNNFLVFLSPFSLPQILTRRSRLVVMPTRAQPHSTIWRALLPIFRIWP